MARSLRASSGEAEAPAQRSGMPRWSASLTRRTIWPTSNGDAGRIAAAARGA